jgi:hypothetical protein
LPLSVHWSGSPFWILLSVTLLLFNVSTQAPGQE